MTTRKKPAGKAWRMKPRRGLTEADARRIRSHGSSLAVLTHQLFSDGLYRTARTLSAAADDLQTDVLELSKKNPVLILKKRRRLSPSPAPRSSNAVE